MKNILKSLFYLLFPVVVGSIVGLVTSQYIDYNTLIKPPLSPPGIVFPIVWTIIYILLGISYFIFKRNHTDSKTSVIYYLQLFVNYMWSIIFFVWKFRFFIIIWTLLLDGLVIYLYYLYSKKSKVSSYLLIPYIIWILFATYLTIGIYVLN